MQVRQETARGAKVAAVPRHRLTWHVAEKFPYGAVDRRDARAAQIADRRGCEEARGREVRQRPMQPRERCGEELGREPEAREVGDVVAAQRRDATLVADAPRASRLAQLNDLVDLRGQQREHIVQARRDRHRSMLHPRGSRVSA